MCLPVLKRQQQPNETAKQTDETAKTSRTQNVETETGETDFQRYFCTQVDYPGNYMIVSYIQYIRICIYIYIFKPTDMELVFLKPTVVVSC